MPTLTTKSFTELVRSQAAAIQASAAGLIDFSVGSILRAFAEANAYVATWLQGLIVILLAATRAATATGTDLDTWMADYMPAVAGSTSPRLPAIAAAGQVTFSRFTTSAQGQVAPGAVVATADGSQSYTVVTDTTNAAWNAGLNAYVLNISQASVTVPVLANKAGAAGNAVAGAVSVIVGALTGIDTVTNAAGFTSGADPETDAQLRARFQLYVASLSKATVPAVGYAITSMAQGLSYLIVEDQNYAGDTQHGHFFVIVDDGTGSPPNSTITAAAAAIELVRPTGISYGVFAPAVVTVNVALTIVLFNGADLTAVQAAVTAALTAFVDTLPLGAGLPISRISGIAYDASAGVANVTGVTLNSAGADITVTTKQVIKLGTLTVSH